MTDDQTRERAEKYAARAHAAETALTELRDKYRHLERDRNALLAQVRELHAIIDDMTEGLRVAACQTSTAAAEALP